MSATLHLCNHCWVMPHEFGYVSERLTARERKHFLGLLEDSRAARATLAALIAVLQSWVVRFEEA